MPYPTIGEYKDAIRLAEHSFGSLTHLRPEYDATGDLHFSSGNFAVVFKMRDTLTNRPVAVKCFVREQPLRRQRYAQISACLDALHSPYLLRYTYHPAEIWVETTIGEQREFEVVTLDWVEGQTLYNYLQSRCDVSDTAALQKVAEAFDRMATWLLEQPFAHGDLKPDNIIVRPRGELVLVDYDGMFTPDMAGQEATELGSPAFRHPRRSLRDFGKYIDHVPILVLSLSLHVLAEHPDWLKTYYQGDNLIVTANDLSNPDSNIFHIINTKCKLSGTQKRLIWLLQALNISKTNVLSSPKSTLVPFQLIKKGEANKWGFVNQRQEITIPCLYDNLSIFREGRASVKRNGKWGFVDESGREIIPCIYDLVTDFSDGLARVRKHLLFEGFIDKTGKEVIPCIYNSLTDFSDGRAIMRKNWKYGTIDKWGKEYILGIYDHLRNLENGLIKAEKNGKWGILDETGKELVPCIYEDVMNFSEGMAVVQNNWKKGFVDRAGKEIMPCIYDRVTDFREGLAGVEINGEWKFVNASSQKYFSCYYDSVRSFSEGLAGVEIGEKWGFIDKTGKEIIPCIYDTVKNFSGGLARVGKKLQIGLVDMHGEQIVPQIYYEIKDFIDELAIVNKNWKKGFIDKTGKEVIPCIYDEVEVFCEGFARVKRDGKEFYIDKRGVEYWMEEK